MDYSPAKYKPRTAFLPDVYHSILDAEKLNPNLMAVWALAWCLQNHTACAVIPGCKDAAQVRANAVAADLLQGGIAAGSTILPSSSVTGGSNEFGEVCAATGDSGDHHDRTLGPLLPSP